MAYVVVLRRWFVLLQSLNLIPSFASARFELVFSLVFRAFKADNEVSNARLMWSVSAHSCLGYLIICGMISQRDQLSSKRT